MNKTITRKEAMALLGITREQLNAMIADNRIRVVRKHLSRYEPMLLDAYDVEYESRKDALNSDPDRFKQVGVVRGSDLLMRALQAVGLRPTLHPTMVAAIAATREGDVPIVIMCDSVTDGERVFVARLRDQIIKIPHFNDDEVRATCIQACQAVGKRIAKAMG